MNAISMTAVTFILLTVKMKICFLTYENHVVFFENRLERRKSSAVIDIFKLNCVPVNLFLCEIVIPS